MVMGDVKLGLTQVTGNRQWVTTNKLLCVLCILRYFQFTKPRLYKRSTNFRCIKESSQENVYGFMVIDLRID